MAVCALGQEACASMLACGVRMGQDRPMIFVLARFSPASAVTGLSAPRFATPNANNNASLPQAGD